MRRAKKACRCVLGREEKGKTLAGSEGTGLPWNSRKVVQRLIINSVGLLETVWTCLKLQKGVQRLIINSVGLFETAERGRRDLLLTVWACLKLQKGVPTLINSVGLLETAERGADTH